VKVRKYGIPASFDLKFFDMEKEYSFLIKKEME